MRGLLVGVLTGVSLLGQVRYARLAEIEGSAEMRPHPAEAWRAALRNAPLVEASSLRTAPGTRVEVELDDGSVLRLAGEADCELSDYTRLSTGQRITHIAVDRGVAYFSGESHWRDALVLAAPGAQITIRRGSRVRLEVNRGSSQVSVIEGEARVATPAVELNVKEGHALRVDPSLPDKFVYAPEFDKLDSDTWSANRDLLLRGGPSAGHLAGLRCGVRDLDAGGTWVDTADFGQAWQPKVPEGWMPFRDGRWEWYEGLGYTWVAAEPWGWVPFHYGRWMHQSALGWIWVPVETRVFRPGDVYWLRSAGVAGWGPLAPGERWIGAGVPELYLKTRTTFAGYEPGAREIDPAGTAVAAPHDPLKSASFVGALPRPQILEARIDFIRSPERAGLIRLAPNAPPSSQAARRQESRQESPPPPPPHPRRELVAPPVSRRMAEPQPVPVVEAPPESYYVAPLYTGIIVINPPERKKDKRDNKHDKTDSKPKPPTPPQAQQAATP